jgi:hypothetical protein
MQSIPVGPAFHRPSVSLHRPQLENDAVSDDALFSQQTSSPLQTIVSGDDPWLDAQEKRRQTIHQNYVQARADLFEARNAQGAGLMGGGSRQRKMEAMVDYLYDQVYAGRESPKVDPHDWARFIEKRAGELVARGLTPASIQQVWEAQSWKDFLTRMVRGAIGSTPFGLGGYVADEVAPFAPKGLSEPGGGLGLGAVAGVALGAFDRLGNLAMPGGGDHYWKTPPKELLDPTVLPQFAGTESTTMQKVGNAAVSFSTGYTLRNLLMLAITVAAMKHGVSTETIGEIKKAVEALGSPAIAGPLQGLTSEVLRNHQAATSGLPEFLGRSDAADMLASYHRNPVDFRSLEGAGNSLILGLNRCGEMVQDMFDSLDRNLTPPRWYTNADGSPGGAGWLPPGVAKFANVGTVSEILLTTALGTTGPLAGIVAKPLIEKFGDVGAKIYQEAFQTTIKAILYAGIGPAIAPDILEGKLKESLAKLEEEKRQLGAQQQEQLERERQANYFVG